MRNLISLFAFLGLVNIPIVYAHNSNQIEQRGLTTVLEQRLEHWERVLVEATELLVTERAITQYASLSYSARQEQDRSTLSDSQGEDSPTMVTTTCP